MLQHQLGINIYIYIYKFTLVKLAIRAKAIHRQSQCFLLKNNVRNKKSNYAAAVWKPTRNHYQSIRRPIYPISYRIFIDTSYSNNGMMKGYNSNYNYIQLRLVNFIVNWYCNKRRLRMKIFGNDTFTVPIRLNEL